MVVLPPVQSHFVRRWDLCCGLLVGLDWAQFSFHTALPSFHRILYLSCEVLLWFPDGVALWLPYVLDI